MASSYCDIFARIGPSLPPFRLALTEAMTIISDDLDEAIAAHAEKRAPRFEGR